MTMQQEKIYVALGNNVQLGLEALECALCEWSSQSIPFIILHINNTSKDFIETPLGKIPASSVNEEKLREYKRREEERADKILCTYIEFCSAKVKVEALKIERSQKHIHKDIINLIFNLKIKTLVIDNTLIQSTSWPTTGEKSVLNNINKHKPDFCYLFIVCRGKLVPLKEEKSDQRYEYGGVVTDLRKSLKEKDGFKGWFSHKMLTISSGSDNGIGETSRSSLRQSRSDATKETRYEDDQLEEIEEYVKCLQASDISECQEDVDEARIISSKEQNKLKKSEADKVGVAVNSIKALRDEARIISSKEQNKLRKSEADKVGVAVNSIKALREKIMEAKKLVGEKKMEVSANVERRSKAEGVISLYYQKAKEIEDSLKEEKAKQAQLTEELERVREQRAKLTEEVEESKGKLSSILELDAGLVTKLNAKKQQQLWINAHFEKAESVRADLVAKIDKVRSQRDKLHRRIKKYKEKELIEDSLSCSFREFGADEVSEATENFSESMVIKADDAEGTTYKGKIGTLTVAVEFKTELSKLSEEEFKAQVEWLCRIRHPHVLAVIGACVDRRCILFEYTPHGATLHDALFSSRSRTEESSVPLLLPWHRRVRIAAEAASAIGFLHSSRPAAIAHGLVRHSVVLFGPYLTVKLSGLLPHRPSATPASDNAALGILILQLLTGEEEVKEDRVKEALANGGDATAIADLTAGDWPSDLAVEFATAGLLWIANCDEEERGEWTAKMVRLMEDLKRRAKERAEVRERGEKQVDMPRVFVCPIFQEIMKQPHVAADGFSYELEAIKEWLDGGHHTSPMTNLRLQNKLLTPNHTLRSLINNWHQDQTKNQ